MENKKKLPFILGVLGLAAFLMFGCTGSDSATKTGSNSGEKATVFKKDDIVKLADVEYRIVDVKALGSSVKGDFDTYTTQGTFVRVDYEVENKGKEAIYASTLKIVDSQDREFSESNDSIWIIDNEDYQFLDQLNPNVKKRFATVFDVAKDAQSLKLKIEGGLFSTDEALIDLGINAQ